MSKKKWLYWAKLLVSVILLIVVYRRVNSDHSVWEALVNIPRINLAICAGFLIPNIYLLFLKWRYLLRTRFDDVKNRNVFGSLLFGCTLGLITPGKLGELGRGLFFANKDQLAITGLNIMDKLANQLLVFTLGGLSLVFLSLRYQMFSSDIIAPLLTIAVLILIITWGIMLNPPLLKRILQKLFGNTKIAAKLRPLLSAFDGIRQKDSLAVMGFTTGIYTVIICQYHVLVAATNLISIWESFQAVMAMLFIKTLMPVSFGDLGTREMLSVYFYSAFQVTEASVFNASLIIFFINVLMPALFGIYYVFQVKAEASSDELLR